MTEACVLPSPTGWLRLAIEDGAIATLGWTDSPGSPPEGALAREAAAQIAAYFDGDRREFDLPLRPAKGFAGRVRQALLAIPFGETCTYGQLAASLGVSPQGAGQACGANPIPLIVPCHRVLARDGLGGFSGGTGIETKVALLRHEGAAGLLI
ncbi:methylated-DNA--[protein]-cysteine S-methyltransferase [Ponticoccus sp. SC2-23]|uniref:methylated-DNA--[protein]-cysteine S-methyltransferase n=1 Tax=Alexandriicola marinus TaxID=2081710 RepID=UPI000FD83D22|nr:methylated-DNA--[protein]-cysteine S-methyltransferase [Alexandriicola marinus]MBM1221514.1 methylated-DNA--[protein]-cysteine S-methyltransferase [Ponticoccus sp. SC6-9]MBM1226555.1 methylated-DNA--[protein]-cysteine S-methyltransferase [Ponticoccus sp. SC6-15]MBM1230506.1 methylated-DNA--[protein]-cysteine S-methyltransferase [Ponticoccus sp. SC6-38]MBM1235029.1 methylated-DNA--[protein]-cysteine S-methyltransferase [Ponticoccus sp. SC6-45]MBM1239527.1 methylated-DNA--[protein]-cysteine S